MAEHEAQGESHGASHGGGGGGGSHGHGGSHGGGGHEEHEGAPEWLISFADNVALMMGFFVILLAMNMGPKGSTHVSHEPNSNVSEATPEMLDFVIALREAFNNPFDTGSTAPEDQPFIRRIKERNGGEATQDGPTGKFHELQATRPSDYRNITLSVAFDENAAVLTGPARQSVSEAARRLRDQGWVIEVRGHASQFETRQSMEAGMRLSYDRALAVARGLVEGGVKRENLRVVACADHDRLVPRAFDAEAARTNQRVEVVVTNETVQPDPFSTTGN